jgi:hypothetical protein
MPEALVKQELSMLSNNSDAGVPFPAHCRARAVGEIADFSECLAPQPVICPQCIPFGQSHFCQHPQHREIVIRTRQLEQTRPK